MTQRDGNNISIEKTKNRVILTVDSVQFQMTSTLARELGDKLYKCGCDVAQSEQRK